MSFCLQTEKNGPQSSVGEPLHKAGIGAGIALWVERLSEKTFIKFFTSFLPSALSVFNENYTSH